MDERTQEVVGKALAIVRAVEGQATQLGRE